MAEPRNGACEAWASIADVCSPCDDYLLPAGVLEDALDVATDLLFRWSGRQFPGECEETIRPCSRQCAPNMASYRGDQDGTTWAAMCGCTSVGHCGCTDLPEIVLPRGPVIEVSEVKVDGVALDEARYRVDDHRLLVRLPDPDGTNPGWPMCQDIGLASTEADTFEVTYIYGRTPPISGISAAAALGCELALACQPETAGAGRCRLPRRTVQVARQGVSISLIDPSKLFVTEPGRSVQTGLTEVDAFLSAVNPEGKRARGMLLDPHEFAANARRVDT